jgi:hypothetical protein
LGVREDDDRMVFERERLIETYLEEDDDDYFFMPG